MFARLVVLILSIGVVACVLLTARQQRLQAVHELAEVQRRLVEHDRTLWQLRVEIAGRITPEHVESLASRLGPLKPIHAGRLPRSPIVAATGPERLDFRPWRGGDDPPGSAAQ